MMSKTLDEQMQEHITKDGSLYCLGWYLGWNKGYKEATLDGQFSAAELRWIADYMDKMNAQTPT